MNGLRKSTALHVKLSRAERALLRKAARRKTQDLRRVVTQTEILRDGGLSYARMVLVEPSASEVVVA